ncbi:hypothetical protein GWI33_012529, partial [Rhynchophorus ferrugineus]
PSPSPLDSTHDRKCSVVSRNGLPSWFDQVSPFDRCAGPFKIHVFRAPANLFGTFKCHDLNFNGLDPNGDRRR